MKAKNLGKKFDDGDQDILEHFDIQMASRPNLKKNALTLRWKTLKRRKPWLYNG